MKNNTINIFLLLALMLTNLFTFAVPLTNWNDPGVLSGADLVGEPTVSDNPPDNPARVLLSGEDIVSVYYTFDGTTHYFRMDLLAPITYNNMAPEYSIQIDYKAGGLSYGDPTGNDSFSYYVAETLFGIDVILTAHYSNGIFIGAVHRHQADGGQPSNLDHANLLMLSGGNFQNTEALGPGGATATLEWSIDASALNGVGALDPNKLFFVTHDIDPGDGATYDLAQFGAPVPEMNSFVLLLAGTAIFVLARFAVSKKLAC